MITYHVERLGHLGDGIAEGPVFVPGALPGEMVAGNLTGDRLTDVKVIEPSPDRVRPPCKHYKSCGGCSLQHANESLVAFWKKQVVERALEAQGIQMSIDRLETSPARSRRRAVLHGMRTKKGSNVGFFGKNSNMLVNIEECLVLSPHILGALPVYHDLARAGGSRKGMLDFTVLVSDAGLDISVSGGKLPDQQLLMRLSEIAGRHDIARLAWNGEVLVQARRPVQVFGDVSVVPPPGAFLQATKEAELAMANEVRQILSGAKRVVDLFSGCGTLSLPLANSAEVHAVDGLPELTEALSDGWRRAGGLRRVSIETRDLFARPLLSGELDRFDGAIIDPPRAGAAAQTQELAKSGIPVIAAVSCNPVTFAGDARKLLDGGYEMTSLVVIDQFRWSNHVELVAGFAKL